MKVEHEVLHFAAVQEIKLSEKRTRTFAQNYLIVKLHTTFVLCHQNFSGVQSLRVLMFHLCQKCTFFLLKHVEHPLLFIEVEDVLERNQ